MDANPAISGEAPTPASYDPASGVPDEYDVLCEGCGYSLVGIQSDKCPECGHPFDPTQLPFARVPWLHRRRIGRVKAYLATLRFVLARPRHFAEEICRPVRISIDDARSFRRTTVNLVLLAFLLCALELGVLVVANYLREARVAVQPEYMPLVWYLSATTVITLTILFGLRVLLFMMTDLPVFIWRGHPSLRENDLSPIQCYAAASLTPLLVTPILVPVVVFGVLFVDSPTNEVLVPLLVIVTGLLLSVLFYRMLTTPLRLMIGSGVERRRVKIMALYLPVHWLIMAFIWPVITTFVVAAEFGVMQSMNSSLTLQPPSPESFSGPWIRATNSPMQVQWQFFSPPTPPASATQPAVMTVSPNDSR